MNGKIISSKFFRRHESLLVMSLCLMAGIVFFSGIQWGLPSRAADKYLFGSHAAWTGREILDRIGYPPTESQVVELELVAKLRQQDKELMCINATDAQRAHIVRRYRLFSYQPDEMINFLALSEMNQRRDMDPRLYQYGGLWIYPVGALLKTASLAGWVELKADLAYYLDHPEAFGRFYVVARSYSAAWGIAGVWAVWLIARRFTDGNSIAAVIACLGYIFMTVVVNMAHEAKPHLGGAVLMLWAVWGAIKYLDTGRGYWAVACGVLCGASLAMVLSCLPIFSVLVVLLLLRPKSWEWLLMAGGAGALVYGILNPYVIINSIWHPEIVRTSLGYSTAMYRVGWRGEGFFNGVWLIREGATLIMMVLGVIGAGWVIIRWFWGQPKPKLSHGWLLAVPALLSLLQFIALAADKPGEYGRFALFIDLVLGIAAITLLSRLGNKWMVLSSLVVLTLVVVAGGGYLRGFIRDCGDQTSRLTTADRIAALPVGPIVVDARPAPYVLPPLNLFDRPLMMIIGESPIAADVRILESRVTPISWADVQFEVSVKQDRSHPK